MIWAGSPGITKRTEKTAIDTKKSRMIKVRIFLVKYRNIDSIMKAFALRLSGQGCMANPDKRPEPKLQPLIRVLVVNS
jgi:hypothetical protein